MALYEYRCRECKEGFDLMRPMSEADEPAECPGCGSPGERVMSSFAPIMAQSSPLSYARPGTGVNTGGGCCGGGCCGGH